MGRFLIHAMPSDDMEKMFKEEGAQRKNGIAIRQVSSKREGDLLGEKHFGVGETWLQISVMKAKLLNLGISLFNFKMSIVISISSRGVVKMK